MLEPISTRPFDRNKHPSIRANGVLVPDGYILLNDLHGRLHETARKHVQAFAATQPNVFHHVSAKYLTRGLLEQLRKRELGLQGKKVAVIYPGEGAKAVYGFIREAIRREPGRYGPLEFLVKNPIFVRVVRRAVEGKKGQFSIKVGSVDLERFEDASVVLTVDDVISSGQTLNSLKREILKEADRVIESSRLHLGFYRTDYPGASRAEKAKWLACSWLAVEPTKKRPLQAGNEFDKIVAAKLVSHTSGGVPPINSLSTFLQKNEKGVIVRRAYLANVSRSRAFGRMLANIRKAQRRRLK